MLRGYALVIRQGSRNVSASLNGQARPSLASLQAPLLSCLVGGRIDHPWQWQSLQEPRGGSATCPVEPSQPSKASSLTFSAAPLLQQWRCLPDLPSPLLPMMWHLRWSLLPLYTIAPSADLLPNCCMPQWSCGGHSHSHRPRHSSYLSSPHLLPPLPLAACGINRISQPYQPQQPPPRDFFTSRLKFRFHVFHARKLVHTVTVTP